MIPQSSASNIIDLANEESTERKTALEPAKGKPPVSKASGGRKSSAKGSNTGKDAKVALTTTITPKAAASKIAANKRKFSSAFLTPWEDDD